MLNEYFISLLFNNSWTALISYSFITCLSLNILFFMSSIMNKCEFVSSVNNCLLFLFTVYTASQLGWNCVCIYYLMNSRLFTSRQIRETEDEVFHMEMSSLLESFAVCGQHVLLAAQKLSIQPSLTEHREELVTATQNVFLGIVKVK